MKVVPASLMSRWQTEVGDRGGGDDDGDGAEMVGEREGWMDGGRGGMW